MVISSVGLGTKNHFAGEGQQQFSSQSERSQWWLVMPWEPFESQEKSSLLRAATKQRAREDTADWEDLVFAVVICKVCKLVIAL
jgi:hypothetical protein